MKPINSNTDTPISENTIIRAVTANFLLRVFFAVAINEKTRLHTKKEKATKGKNPVNTSKKNILLYINILDRDTNITNITELTKLDIAKINDITANLSAVSTVIPVCCCSEQFLILSDNGL